MRKRIERLLCRQKYIRSGKIKDFCLLLGCYGLVYGVISIFDLCTGWWKGIAIGVLGTLFYETGHVLWYVRMKRPVKVWENHDTMIGMIS